MIVIGIFMFVDLKMKFYQFFNFKEVLLEIVVNLVVLEDECLWVL